MTAKRARGESTPAERLAHRMRELRRQRRWSLERLAVASGVSRSMLSQIERLEANPTLAVTHAIARAFGLSVGELVDAAEGTTPIHVVRADERAAVLREDTLVLVRALTPLRYVGEFEVYEVRLQPGGELRSMPHAVGTRETVVVTAGQVVVGAGNERVRLDAGDSASYRADLPHAISNESDAVCELILVDAYG